jgi:hypothetical protein
LEVILNILYLNFELFIVIINLLKIEK